MMNSVLFFVASFVLKMTVSQTFSHTPLPGEGNSLTVQCSTTDFSGTVFFRLGTDDKGGCLIGDDGLCQSAIDGYDTPTRQDTTITKMTITSCNETRDTGSWTCTYGALASPAVEISSCSEETSTPTDNSSEETSTPTGNSSGDTSTPTSNGSGDTSTPTSNGSGGTSTSTGNKGIVFVMLFVFLLANYSMVDAVCFCTRSTANKCGNCFLTLCQFTKTKFFDCCGSKSSLESEDDPGFFKDKVLTLNASETSRSQSCIRNGTVTPHETVKSQKKSTFDKRKQPDGDEGPQSTPKDPDARHLTTGRPLPRRPDNASPQTGPFDSVNSPRPIVLAPIDIRTFLR